MDYKVHLQCQSGKPVVTVIICTYHIKSEIYVFEETETSILKPIIHYLFECYNEVKYLRLKNKIIDNYKLSHSEIQYLILLPFMVHKNSRIKIIKDVCDLIEEIKNKNLFNDNEMYLPLILAINQYVSDENERNKLIKVLTMDMAADEIYEKVMNSGIYEKGLEQGIEKGEFRTALKFKEFLDVDVISRVTGFSKGELESERLNR